MDIASLIGQLLAVGLILGSIMMGSAPFKAFIDIPSSMVVIGGAAAAAMISFPLKNILGVPKVTMKVFFNKSVDVPALIKEIVSLAETARRDGLLALEGKMDEVDNPFVRMGIQMAIDGSQPEIIEDTMRTETDAIATRHREGKAVMEQMARFAPAYGMIGTLMGLIMMLSDMSDPSNIGTGMAVALITTLYGAIAANVFFSPYAEKLGIRSKQELVGAEIVIRGIMAIQSGENPRVIDQKLQTYLAPKDRPSEAEAA